MKEIKSQVDCDAVLFVHLHGVQDRIVYSSVDVLGTEKENKAFQELLGQPSDIDVTRPSQSALRGFSLGRRPRLLPPAERFRRNRTSRRDRELPAADPLMEVSGALSLTEDMFFWAYQGRRFVGMIRVFRYGSRKAFSADERASLTPLVKPLAQELGIADDAARQELDDNAFAVFGEGADVKYRTAAAKAWLSRKRLNTVKKWLDLPAAERRERRFALDGVAVIMTDLQGTESGTLVQLQNGQSILRVPRTVLTPSQHEIAIMAAEGATAREIAEQLGRGFETVRTHLREAYKRLGVKRRVELAKALEQIGAESKLARRSPFL